MAPIGSYTTSAAIGGRSVLIVVRLSATLVSVDCQIDDTAPFSSTASNFGSVGTEFSFRPVPNVATSVVVRNDLLGVTMKVATTALSVIYSKFLRKIKIEIDLEDTPRCRQFNASYSAELRRLVAKGFNNALVDVEFSDKDSNWVPTVAPQRWTFDSLNQMMGDHFANRGSGLTLRGTPAYHIMIGDKCPVILDKDTGLPILLLGIMYDSNDKSPREGSALFLEHFPINGQPPGRFLDYIAATVVHETGHALNLTHSMGKRPTSLSFMNYPHEYAAAVGRANDYGVYWSDFLPVWNFDDGEKRHLWHAQPKNVLPNGSPFLQGSASVTNHHFIVAASPTGGSEDATTSASMIPAPQGGGCCGDKAAVERLVHESAAARQIVSKEGLPSTDDGWRYLAKYLTYASRIERLALAALDES